MATSNKMSAQPTCATASTICAWASAPGKAGVAVLRISGPHAHAACVHLDISIPLQPRRAHLVRLYDPATQELIDEALALWFPGPHSFTGEDVLELHTHGSPAIMRQLTQILCAHPALRLAEPGEFSRRAYLHGKFDLIAAEGLADLINAETQAQHRQAMHHLRGHIGQRYETLRAQLLEAMALMEAYIDFPDEEIPPAVTSQAANAVTETQATISNILNDNRAGEKIRNGLRVAIIGAPNVGKSSLLNALAQRNAAIVSHQAGTTRDIIEVELDIGGYRMIFSDTAGLRDTTDEIEAEGIRRAIEHATCADLKLLMLDVAHPIFDDATKPFIGSDSIIILNKCDLHPDIPTSALSITPPSDNVVALRLSTKTHEGLATLIETLSRFASEAVHSAHPPLITRERHRLALEEAQSHLQRFCLDAPLELACEDLRMASRAIAKITGKIETDELLDIVFSRFCIGK